MIRTRVFAVEQGEARRFYAGARRSGLRWASRCFGVAATRGDKGRGGPPWFGWRRREGDASDWVHRMGCETVPEGGGGEAAEGPSPRPSSEHPGAAVGSPRAPPAGTSPRSPAGTRGSTSPGCGGERSRSGPPTAPPASPRGNQLPAPATAHRADATERERAESTFCARPGSATVGAGRGTSLCGAFA